MAHAATGLSAVATLPIIVELVCWCYVRGADRSIHTIVDAYKYALEDVYKREYNKVGVPADQKPSAEESTEVFTACGRIAAKVLCSGESTFALDLRDPVQRNIRYSGLVRVVREEV